MTKTPGGFFIANTATLCGDVTVGELSSFWFSAVCRGDVDRIVIGKRVNVQDCAVIHCDAGIPNEIGDDIVIGHSAIVHGRSVGSGTMIGMAATVLNGVKVGGECLIAAGAVVPPGMDIPDRMVVMGVPGKIVRPIKDKELEMTRTLVKRYAALAQKYVEGAFLDVRDR